MGKEMQTIFNLLSDGIHVKGNIQSLSDIRIDGILEGRVETEGKLILGIGSQVMGDVKSSNIDIFGMVDGSIECSGTVILRPSAHVRGSIKSVILVVELGAILDGCCEAVTPLDRTILPENPKKK